MHTRPASLNLRVLETLTVRGWFPLPALTRRLGFPHTSTAPLSFRAPKPLWPQSRSARPCPGPRVQGFGFGVWSLGSVGKPETWNPKAWKPKHKTVAILAQAILAQVPRSIPGLTSKRVLSLPRPETLNPIWRCQFIICLKHHPQPYSNPKPGRKPRQSQNLNPSAVPGPSHAVSVGLPVLPVSATREPVLCLLSWLLPPWLCSLIPRHD